MMSRYGKAGLIITMSAPSSMSRAISRMASVPLAGSIWYERRSPDCGVGTAGLPKRSVEARGVLRGVGHNGRLRVAGLVQGFAARPHATVHHVRGRHHVRARLDVGEGGAGDQLQGGIVAHRAPLDDAAVP